MNVALDSPLEALAVNYLAYGFITAVNNIWAWVAVITAAVSFWRIRALPSLPSTPEVSSRSRDAASITSNSIAPPPVAESTAAETDAVPTVVAPAKVPGRVLEREGSVKMKFSLYYENEKEEEEEDNNGGGAAVVMSQEIDAWRDDWERVMEMRMGDMGWYRWQDRTVIDGSVVRLWEGRRPRHAAAQVVGGGGAWSVVGGE